MQLSLCLKSSLENLITPSHLEAKHLLLRGPGVRDLFTTGRVENPLHILHSGFQQLQFH